MFKFQAITEDMLGLVLEIVNSNTDYNMLENGNAHRTLEEVRRMFLNQTTDSYIIVLNNKYIGLVDFLKTNPKDNTPWIGLFMIHGNHHSKGYGKRAYTSFEEELKKQCFAKVRIGILSKNISAKKYWTSMGFAFYAISQWEGQPIECFEKSLL